MNPAIAFVTLALLAACTPVREIHYVQTPAPPPAQDPARPIAPARPAPPEHDSEVIFGAANCWAIIDLAQKVTPQWREKLEASKKVFAALAADSGYNDSDEFIVRTAFKRVNELVTENREQFFVELKDCLLLADGKDPREYRSGASR